MTCDHDFENVLHPSRAMWVCPSCGEDISIAYYLWCEVTHQAPGAIGGYATIKDGKPIRNEEFYLPPETK